MRLNRIKGIITILSMVIMLTACAEVEASQNDSNDLLPVLDNTAVYPELTFNEQVDMAQKIIYGTVVNIDETMLIGEQVYLNEEMTDVAAVLFNPVTPVTLHVINSYKGDDVESVVYYEDGGKTDSYIIRPSGYQMKTGMEVFLFINNQGYGWGSQSVFPVFNDMVIINESVNKIVAPDLVSNITYNELGCDDKNMSIDASVRVMKKADFVSLIQKSVGEMN